jgi:hypothetical protein
VFEVIPTVAVLTTLGFDATVEHGPIVGIVLPCLTTCCWCYSSFVLPSEVVHRSTPIWDAASLTELDCNRAFCVKFVTHCLQLQTGWG